MLQKFREINLLVKSCFHEIFLEQKNREINVGIKMLISRGVSLF